MIEFTTVIQKFRKKGEKSGWTYIDIPMDIAQKLMPGNKKSFRVKGFLDQYKFSQFALLPMGEGAFIMPLKADVRKAIGKRDGAMLRVRLQVDKSEFIFNAEFLECLDDDEAARSFFNSLPGSHQKYFSKWIDSAKTDATKAKRIAAAINGLARKMKYNEMLRAQKNNYS